MLIVEFLALYAQLFINRAAKEYPALKINPVFTEDSDGNGVVILDVAGRPGIELSVAHPLLGVLEDAYTPVLEDAQWGMFIQNATGAFASDTVH